MAKSCRARMSLPSDDGITRVIFTCDKPDSHNNDIGELDAGHRETGNVQLLNGKSYSYDMFWAEIEPYRHRAERRVQDVASSRVTQMMREQTADEESGYDGPSLPDAE